MKKSPQFVCCLLVYLLVVLYKDSCAEAHRSSFNSEEDSTPLQKKKFCKLSKVESKVAEFQPSSEKKVEEKILAANSNGGGGSDPETKRTNTKDILAEEEQVRELLDHIDYAGATTHPPSEPPKKKKTNSNQKSLRPPSHAH